MEEGGDGWNMRGWKKIRKKHQQRQRWESIDIFAEFQIYQVGYCAGSNWKESIETNIDMGHILEVAS